MPLNYPRIEHLIVLMLENRSFDHMLGFAGIPGVDGLTGSESNPDTKGELVKVSTDARYVGSLEPDPGHELFDVNEQIFSAKTMPEHCNYCACTVDSVNVQVFSNKDGTPGDVPAMQGFVKSSMKSPATFLVPQHHEMLHPRSVTEELTRLAQEYAVCDKWFSSSRAPRCPTEPSYTPARRWGKRSLSGLKLKTIYKLLNDHGMSAKIYYQDYTMALTFKELLGDQNRYFGFYADFLAALKDPAKLPNYCFIEPRYYSNDAGGVHEPDDQHPDHDVRNGERLIRDVYLALISNEEVWNKSVLVIVYDEHGGLYDHVVPPVRESPDDLVSKDPAFDFKRLGRRVPAVIVSPYIPAETVDHTVYDHTSIIATARKLFLPDSANTALTKCDKAAYTFDDGLLTLKTPRPAPEVRPCVDTNDG